MIVDLSVVTQFLNKIVFFFSLFRVIFPLCVCVCLLFVHVCLDAHPLIQVKCVCLFVLSFLVSLKQNLSCKSHQTLFCLTQKKYCARLISSKIFVFHPFLHIFQHMACNGCCYFFFLFFFPFYLPHLAL